MKHVLFILLVFISIQGFSQSVKIRRCDSLEVMTKDLVNLTWDEAKKACEELGDGWRLPTIEELRFIYDKRAEIGNLKVEFYWSSSEDSVGVWSFHFSNFTGAAHLIGKENEVYVRAVRDLK